MDRLEALPVGQVNVGLPNFVLPRVFSLLGVEDMCRCACVAREWAKCLQIEPMATRVIDDRPIAIAHRIGDDYIAWLLESDKKAALASSEGHYGDYTCLHYAAEENYLYLVEALLESGSHIDAKDEYGQSPLCLAAIRGHYIIVRLLVAVGAQIDSRDLCKRTPLMEAAWKGHLEVVQLLLDRGAYVDARSNGGDTALLLAASEGHTLVVSSLIFSGADLDLRDDGGMTALHLARTRDHDDIVFILQQEGATQ